MPLQRERTVTPAASNPAQDQPPAPHPSIGPTLIRQLLREQFPDLADLPIGERRDGWDMATFRLGDDRAVRLPRWTGGMLALATEFMWLPALSDQWTFPMQKVLRTGDPGGDYPWVWAVVTWLEGDTALETPLAASAAVDLGLALRQVHQPAPDDAPLNAEQSVPLHARESRLLANLELLGASGGHHLDVDAAHAVWEAALAAPMATTATWIHADLHFSNVISRGGEFAGIVDWTDIAAGDPAVDLGFAWTLFPATAMPALWGAYGDADDGLVARSRGIALCKLTDLALYPKADISAAGWRGLTELGVASLR